MKKSLLAISALLVLSALSITSCQKDKVGPVSFEATMEYCEDDDGKTAFTNGTMQWVSGDQIKVFGTAGSGVYQASVRNGGRATFNVVSGDAGEAPYRAFYPASAANDNGTVELPVVQVTEDGSLTGFPMYAQGSSTNLDFKNLCGVLRMRLQKSGVSITAIEVTGDIELTGDHSVVYSGGVPTLEYSGHGTKTTMMTCRTPQSISNQKDFYIFLPVHTYSAGMRIRIYSSDGGVCTKTVSAGNSVRIQRSKITTIALRANSLTFAPNAGALPGLFTIDDQGHQVRFSQGNLQYTTLGGWYIAPEPGSVKTGVSRKGEYTSLGIWRFAPEQYEYVGEDNQYISDAYPKWIDLFGWGTGSNPTLNSDEFNDWNRTFVDWGTNVISNGGNQPNIWRTLSRDEWTYLFNNHQYGTGNINGVHGLILLPDNWTLPADCSFISGVSDDWHDWARNSYTLAQWAQMEGEGALFLPYAGERWVRPMLYNFGGGYYWSSTCGEYNVLNAYSMYFDNVNGVIIDLRTGGFGLSVRIVRDN